MQGFSARIRRIECLPNGLVRVEFRSGLVGLVKRNGSHHSGPRVTTFESGEIADATREVEVGK